METSESARAIGSSRVPRTLMNVLTVTGYSLVAFAAIGSLAWPIGGDQAIFAWVGSVILDGGIPYKNAWDVKGPLTHYVYAVALAVFGYREVSIRLLDLIAVVICCLLLRRLVMRLNGSDTFGANCAAICFALTYYGLGYWCTAQPDGWAGILLLAVVLMLLTSSGWPLRTMAITGVLIGLATQFKIVFSIFMLLPLCFPTGAPRWRDGRLKLLVSSVFGFLLTNSVFVALIKLNDGLEDFMDILKWLSYSYLPQRHVLAELRSTWTFLVELGLVIPCALTPIGIIWMHHRAVRRDMVVVMTWLAVTLLVVIIQGRYFEYHWIPAIISLAAIFGVTFTSVGRRWLSPAVNGIRVQTGAFLTCVLVLASLAARVLSDMHELPGYLLGLRKRVEYVGSLTHGYPYLTYERLSGYIIDHSSRSDTVLMWGPHTVVNVLSQRRSPTRFGCSYPVVAIGPLQSKYRQLFIKEISTEPPRFIILDIRGIWLIQRKSGLQHLRGFPEFEAFLRANYVPVADQDGLQLWELKREPLRRVGVAAGTL